MAVGIALILALVFGSGGSLACATIPRVRLTSGRFAAPTSLRVMMLSEVRMQDGVVQILHDGCRYSRAMI
jgi:hypothetical protein